MENKNIVSEAWDFLKIRKKWWLAPILIFLFLVGLIIVFIPSVIHWILSNKGFGKLPLIKTLTELINDLIAVITKVDYFKTKEIKNE